MKLPEFPFKALWDGVLACNVSYHPATDTVLVEWNNDYCTYNLVTFKDIFDDGLYTVVEEVVAFSSTLDKIKEFVNTSKVSDVKVVGNNQYHVVHKNGARGGYFVADSDEHLLKLMEAMQLIEKAMVIV